MDFISEMMKNITDVSTAGWKAGYQQGYIRALEAMIMILKSRLDAEYKKQKEALQKQMEEAGCLLTLNE